MIRSQHRAKGIIPVVIKQQVVKLAWIFHKATRSRRGSPRGYKRKCYEVCF